MLARSAQRLLSLPLAMALTAGTAMAAPAQLPSHHPRHPAAPSTLPAPHLVGVDANRLGRVYGGTPIDVTQYHYDLNRTGWNPTETDLTPATVASSKFGLLQTLKVDGNVFAQPLVVSNFVFPDKSVHSVLIVATGNNSVYAYDAQTYALLWNVNLGPAQKSNDVGCGDVVPEYGISSTPVIVRGAATATIYLIAATEPSSGTFVSTLHALNLATGADTRTPTVIAPSATLSDGSTVAFDPQNQWSRASLAYNKGRIYVGIGSHCDNNDNSITGWLLAFNEALSQIGAFHTVQTPGGTELASIWMSGFAPAINANGSVFVVTGNGDFTRGQKDWGQSVLKLNPALTGVQSAFTDSTYVNLNNNDTDFGSGGVMLLPPVSGQTAPPLAVAMGKSSELFLLSQTQLGGVKPNEGGALQSQYAGGNGVWGGPAYWNGSAGPIVLTQTDSDVLKAWSVNTGSTPSLTLVQSGTSQAGYGGSLPIVSSNAAAPGTGVVWLINRAQEPFSIEAYDAAALGSPIFSSQIGIWSNSNGNPFLTPIEVNGRVYAPGYKVVRVFGLTP
jgi:hypothetical protein